MQEPTSSSELAPIRPKSSHFRRPWWLAAPVGVMIAATAAGSYWAMSPRSSNLSGMNLLPANTTMAIQVAIDRGDWLRIKQLGTPTSRAILERELAKWSKETWGDAEFARDIQPWVGNEIYLARLAKGESLALLPIRTQAPPATGGSRQYRGVTIWETQKASRAIMTGKDQKFLAIGSASAIEQAIAAQQLGQSLAKAPGYARAVKTITGGDAIAQVYVNIPAVLASKNSNKLTSQAVLVNISAKDNVLSGKGVLWGSQKLVASKNSPEFAQTVPASTMLLVSGSNLGRVWQEYLPLAANNPRSPIQPQVLQDKLKSSTGLDLNTDILKWGSGEFGVAMIPQAQLDAGSVGGSLLLLSKSIDPVATNRTFASLDKTMVDRYQFKVSKVRLQDAEVVAWSSAVGGTHGTHGWLKNQVAFLTLGAPVTEQFLPTPSQSLSSSKDFQQVMQQHSLSPYDGQLYVDINKMVASGNLPLGKFPADTQAVLGAINSIGLVSNAVSEQDNRFDFSISIKSISGK
jgi:Protein of unknown function (DUF3352)